MFLLLLLLLPSGATRIPLQPAIGTLIFPSRECTFDRPPRVVLVRDQKTAAISKWRHLAAVPCSSVMNPTTDGPLVGPARGLGQLDAI